MCKLLPDLRVNTRDTTQLLKAGIADKIGTERHFRHILAILGYTCSVKLLLLQGMQTAPHELVFSVGTHGATATSHSVLWGVLLT